LFFSPFFPCSGPSLLPSSFFRLSLFSPSFLPLTFTSTLTFASPFISPLPPSVLYLHLSSLPPSTHAYSPQPHHLFYYFIFYIPLFYLAPFYFLCLIPTLFFRTARITLKNTPFFHTHTDNDI
ncbi:hypothetical protein BKA57DRAFT_422626, partial [Linnemannia elongata]